MMVDHETIKSNRKVVMASNRSFGVVFSAVFAILTFWRLIMYGDSIRWWALLPAATFLGLGLYADHYLSPLNKLWYRFGLLLHSMISPLIMGILFYCVITPVAYVIRYMRRDILRLALNDERSYWIKRQPPGPQKNSMSQQF